MLSCKFANGIGRNRVRSHVLRFRQGWCVAIRRGGCRIDYASYFCIARRHKQVHSGVNAGAICFQRVVDRAGYRRDRSVIST